jgi:hypothetical protein
VTPKQKILAGVAVLAAGVLYVKRSQAATAGGQALGPLGASSASGGALNAGVGGSASGIGSLLSSLMNAITAPSNAFAPTPSLVASPELASLPVSSAGIAALASVGMASPAPYFSPVVNSSESFWAAATAPEPLPGVWGYQPPGMAAAPAYGTPAAAPGITYTEADSSYNPAPAYGSNLELASRQWIEFDANTGGAGSGAGA